MRQCRISSVVDVLASLLIVIQRLNREFNITKISTGKCMNISSSIRSFASLYINHQIIFCAFLPLLPHPYHRNEALHTALKRFSHLFCCSKEPTDEKTVTGRSTRGDGRACSVRRR